MIGDLHGPVSASTPVNNKLGAVQGLIQLLTDAGYTPGAFDAQELLDCDLDQVIRATVGLFNTLIPLVGQKNLVDRPITQFTDSPKGYHTGSSHYASAESELCSDESIKIEMISLGPFGMPVLRQRNNPIKMEPRSGAESVVDNTMGMGSDQL